MIPNCLSIYCIVFLQTCQQLLENHIKTFLIISLLLAQQTFRNCQVTADRARSTCGLCASKMFLYSKLIVDWIRTNITFRGYPTIRRLRALGINYFPIWMLPADNINHIKTHWRNRTVAPPALREEADAHRSSNELWYGRGTGTRTLIDRLKAGYSSLWIIPPYGP